MPKPESKFAFPIPLAIGLLVMLGLGTAGYMALRARSAGVQEAALTPEAKAYTKFLKLSEVEMKATASYLGHEIVEIVGKIANTGGTDTKQIDVTCVFHDPYGQVVRRARVSIVKPSTGVLAPNGTRTFRLPFDDIPASWNRAMPQLVIAQILF